MRAHAMLLSWGMLALAGPAAAEELKNWFDDPFLQVRNGAPACPAPLGPLISEEQKRAEAHYRVERGTSCWLEGKCRHPNSYLYDPEIAQAVQKSFAATQDFAEASLWVTVQRRFVIVQGCISEAAQAKRIEALMRAVPDVEHVILQLAVPGNAETPYPLAPGKASKEK